MKKVIVRQKTGGNEWIALAATLAFLIGSVLMIISHFNKKVDATIPVLIAFIGCTIIVLVVTIRLFCTRNVLVLKDNKLILKDIFMNKWLIIFAILLTACTGTSEKSEECITIDLATHIPGKLI